MTFLDLLAYKKLTLSKLSQISEVPLSTLSDIATTKTDLASCKGSTLLKLSKVLDVTIEDLLNLESEEQKGVIPDYVYDSIIKLRKNIIKDSLIIDCCYDELQSNINIAEIENQISHEKAFLLRKRYF